MSDDPGPVRRVPPFVISVVFLLIGAVAGVATFVSLAPQQSTGTSGVSIREKESLPYVSPLLACDNGHEIDSKEHMSIKEAVKKTIDEQKGLGNADAVSLYYRDLGTGDSISVNGHEHFAPASLFKVAYMMLIYKLSEDDPALLSQQLQPVTSSNMGTQYFTPSEPLDPSRTYSVDELVARMIIDSDNQAMQTLFTVVPDARLNELYDQLRVVLPKHLNDDFVTARDYTLFLRILYNASYLSEKNSEKALELLIKSTWRKGLVAWLPQDLPVADKFGERLDQETGQHQLHDCGIVYVPDHPYAVCIMTKGTDFDRLANTIASVSQVVYQNVVK